MMDLITDILDIKEFSEQEFDKYFGDNEYARRFKHLVISGDIPFLKITNNQTNQIEGKRLLDEIYILLKKIEKYT